MAEPKKHSPSAKNRNYVPIIRCKAKKADGSRCRGAGSESKDSLCNIHYAIKYGEKLPQEFKTKRISDTSIPVMLRKFGMPAKDVTQLRKAFPDLDSTIIGNASVDAIMMVLYKVLVMKTIAGPRSDIADTTIKVAQFLKNQEGGLSLHPHTLVDVSDADNGDFETPPGLDL